MLFCFVLCAPPLAYCSSSRWRGEALHCGSKRKASQFESFHVMSCHSIRMASQLSVSVADQQVVFCYVMRCPLGGDAAQRYLFCSDFCLRALRASTSSNMYEGSTLERAQRVESRTLYLTASRPLCCCCCSTDKYCTCETERFISKRRVFFT